MSAFGKFVLARRTALNLSLRGFSRALGMTPTYIGDIEKGRRNPNEKSLLDKMAKALELDEKQTEKLFDLAAAQKKDDIPQDLASYIGKNKAALRALRRAKAAGATGADWNRFANSLEK